ncbi:hypothetical protein NDU88_003672 [Pleurodeles waltl]|uniref:Uncharacterized protein n=1 Tax=Pleurodeles waltl TaxID=8319 RepID=A0AAV7NH27_PLEWA|nr:hypothetical protein NDU88_003672 [Pleurodeles waltl]
MLLPISHGAPALQRCQKQKCPSRPLGVRSRARLRTSSSGARLTALHHRSALLGDCRVSPGGRRAAEHKTTPCVRNRHHRARYQRARAQAARPSVTALRSCGRP